MMFSVDSHRPFREDLHADLRHAWLRRHQERDGVNFIKEDAESALQLFKLMEPVTARDVGYEAKFWGLSPSSNYAVSGDRSQLSTGGGGSIPGPNTSTIAFPPCRYCGQRVDHPPEQCPLVRAVEYDKQGNIKRVELGPRVVPQPNPYPWRPSPPYTNPGPHWVSFN